MDNAVIASSLDDAKKLTKKFGIQYSDIYLWKPDFSEYKSLKNHNIFYLGESIENNLLDEAEIEFHKILKNWYQDVDGNDLSFYKNCSLGLTFQSSLEIVFYNLVLSYITFTELSKKYKKIYINAGEDDVKTFAAQWINNNCNNRFEFLYHKNKKSLKQKVHYMVGFRDLNFQFRGSIIDSILAKILFFVQLPFKKTKNICITNAGKFDEYIQISNKSRSLDYRLLLPLNRKFRSFLGSLFFWQRINSSYNQNASVEIIKKLNTNKNNITSSVVPNELYKKAIEVFLYPYFSKAISYYEYYLKIFKFFDTSLAIYGTDGVERFILSAYAAKKSNIPTAYMPHGIAFWSNHSMVNDSNRAFDYYLSLGNFDSTKYQKLGLNIADIRDICIPWFAKSNFKVRSKKKKNNVCALLLPLDPGYSLKINAKTIVDHLHDMIEVCNQLNIEIIGVKFREADNLAEFGFSNGKNLIKNQHINVFGGYGEISKYFSEVDMVIGPPSSALVETFLAEKKFYAFQDLSCYRHNPNISYELISEYIDCASNKTELIENINMNNIFKENSNIDSIINSKKTLEEAFKITESTFNSLTKKSK